MLIDAAVLAGSQTGGIAPHSFNILSRDHTGPEEYLIHDNGCNNIDPTATDEPSGCTAHAYNYKHDCHCKGVG